MEVCVGFDFERSDIVKFWLRMEKKMMEKKLQEKKEEGKNRDPVATIT